MPKELSEGLLLGMGNPLLDISAVVDDDLLKKYGMKKNDAILAEEKHKPLNAELIETYNAQFIAGGSVQNSLRVAQWILEKPKVTTYFGCVGRDKFSKILEAKAQECGVCTRYQYVDDTPTGTCSVLVTNGNRSLCADLSAANCFTIDHIKVPENISYIDQAQFYYVSGFFLTVCPAAILSVAEVAFQHNKPFIMNLSATFISKFFKEPLMSCMPYVDVLFGNEEEAATFAEEQNFPDTKDLKKIALRICELPKKNMLRSRVVIITQGHEPVILAHEGKIKEIPVQLLSKDKIIDTNGAGDAFAGGFLSQYIQDESLENCCICGIYAATEIIQRSGCTFDDPRVGTFKSYPRVKEFLSTLSYD